MADAACLVRSWRVGRWTATLTVPAINPGLRSCALIEWSPAMPGRPLTPSELAQYRAGRDAALADVARAKGLSTALLEFGRGIETRARGTGGAQ